MKKILILSSAMAMLTATAYAQDTKTKTSKDKVKVKSGDVKVKIDEDGTKIKTPEGKQLIPPGQRPKIDYTAMGFTRTENGLLYKVIVDAPGGNTPKVGDHVEMHINTHVGDSMLFNSRKLNNNMPVPFQLPQAAFKGDLSEGLMMLTPGDSAIFLISVDSLQKSGSQLLPWMQSGDMIEYEVVMVSVKTMDQLKKEQDEKSAQLKVTEEKTFQDYFAKNKIKPLKTASGMYYIITKKGTGPNAKAGQMVTANYTGKTMDGNVFDSNIDPKFGHVQPFTFSVGQRQVIQGWDEGFMLLNKGSKATLFIPSGMAYGERSPSPQIPANSILIFDVELVDIGDNKPAPAGHSENDGHQH